MDFAFFQFVQAMDAKLDTALDALARIDNLMETLMSKADDVLREANETQGAVSTVLVVLQAVRTELEAARASSTQDNANLDNAIAILDKAQADIGGAMANNPDPGGGPVPTPQARGGGKGKR